MLLLLLFLYNPNTRERGGQDRNGCARINDNQQKQQKQPERRRCGRINCLKKKRKFGQYKKLFEVQLNKNEKWLQQIKTKVHRQ